MTHHRSEILSTLLVVLKPWLFTGSLPNVSGDLNSSFHLLLGVCDVLFANVVQGSRAEDLIRPEYQKFTWSVERVRTKKEWSEKTTIKEICRRNDGLILEAKDILYHWLVPKLLSWVADKVSSFENILYNTLVNLALANLE